MEEVDKRLLSYYIVSYTAGLIDSDVSDLTDNDVVDIIEQLEQFSYEDLLQIYNYLNTMFIEKFGIEEE
jgi:hypothetical protein|nr:MAG TPA_asm: hypothetical protein [Caudoviricetes sp.]